MKTFYKHIGLILISLMSFTSFGQLLSEGLTTGSLPGGWSESDIDFATSAGGYANFTSSTATLTTSSFDASAYCGVTVTFDVAKFGSGGDGPITVEYSLDGGANWITAGNSPTPSSSTYVPASITINAASANMIIRLNRGSSASQKRVRNFVVTEIPCVGCGGLDTQPTNEASGQSASNIACTTADIDWTNGADATNSLVVISTSPISGTPTDGVAYTASSVYAVGSIIGAGEFVIYNGTGNSVSIGGLTEGTTYFITIFEYNGTIADCEENYLTGGVSNSFTTLTGCVSTDPYISSINYNACTGSEGTDEIVTFITGSDPIDIDDIVIGYPSGGDFCNSGCGTQTNGNNPTYVNDLNVMAGCAVFTYANPIPPNATVMIFTGNPPSVVLDFSSQCGAANLPVYVIFSNNNSISGRFANSAERDLTIDWGNGTSQTVTYDGSEQGGDGATAQFDAAGNPTYFQSTDCIYPLPIELLFFNGTSINSNTTLNWATASERNNDYFKIEKSTDGKLFFPIGKVNGNGNSSQQITYSFIDDSPSSITTYYRLKQVNYDGEFQYSYPVKIENTNSTIYYANNQIHLGLNGKSNLEFSVNIYNLNGQLLYSETSLKSEIINWNKKGLFIIEIPELQLRQKLFCH